MWQPKYRHHKPSGRAVIQYKPLYGENPIYLDGAYNSPESLAHYDRLVPVIMAHRVAAKQKKTRPVPMVNRGSTIAEMMDAYHPWARDYYGEDSSDFGHIEQMIYAVFASVGDMRCEDFGPLALKKVRQWMVETYDPNPPKKSGRKRKLVWSRQYINAQIIKLRRMFRWAVENEYIDSVQLGNLKAVPGIRPGQTTAPEAKPIEAVEWSVASRVLPHVCPMVAAMVQIQYFGGMRPGEVVRIGNAELDRTFDDCWLFMPVKHKTAWRGKQKVICLGPKSIALLKPYLNRAIDEGRTFVFSPSIAWEEYVQRRRFERATKQYGKPAETKPRTTVGDRYTTHSYHQAIKHGFKRMDKLDPQEAAIYNTSVILDRWHPNQLRHGRATEVNAVYAVEAAEAKGNQAAMAMLGHSSIAALKVYAKPAVKLSMRVAREIG